MQTGTKISAGAHVALIGWAVFGTSFSSDPLPFEVAEVSVITAEEYAALTAPAPPPIASVAPEVPQPPEAVEDPPVVEPIPEPEAPTPPEPQDASEPPSAEPEVAEQEAPVEPPLPKPSERVAPEVVAPPPPDASPDEETKTEVAPDEGAEVEQEQQEATAPEEASDQIVPETPEIAALAPVRSVRPPSARPSRPKPTPAAELKPEQPKPAETKPAEPQNTSDAVNDALAEALGGTNSADPTPAGPPLSAGEKDALRVSVSRCWNVGALSSAALATTVVVKVSMAQNGKPDSGSITLLSSSGGDGSAAKQAFEAARRAIIRCGSKGFDLPSEKYAHWRDIEMTFNPERMRIK